MNNSEALVGIIGLAMLYATGHFLVVQHNKIWEQRTGYEKAVTVVAIITIALIYLGMMFGE